MGRRYLILFTLPITLPITLGGIPRLLPPRSQRSNLFGHQHQEALVFPAEVRNETIGMVVAVIPFVNVVHD